MYNINTLLLSYQIKCFAFTRTSVNNGHRNKNLALINFVNFPGNVA